MPAHTPPRLPTLADDPGAAARQELAGLKAAALPAGTRKPEWLRVQLPGGERYKQVKETLRGLALHTVCEEAQCPNVGECWSGGTATVMLLGDLCTRACRFCHVKSAAAPPPPDPHEPRHLADAVRKLSLDYVVVTSVDRDDLPDGGAAHFAEAIVRLREIPGLLIEVLTPDFQGDPEAVRTIGRAAPHVFGNNLETVRRLTPVVRDARAGYDQTLEVLALMHGEFPGVVTKSSLLLGLGETDGELRQAFADLRAAGVEILTLGQYLRPSEWHLPVVEFVPPERFRALQREGEQLGFRYVAAGPLVRSSYRAAELFLRGAIAGRRGGMPAEEGERGHAPND